MLCKIRGFHGVDYEEYRSLGSDAVWLLYEPMFHRVRRLLVTANVVPSSPILVTLMTEAKFSSKTSVFKRATRRHIPEDDILLTKTNIFGDDGYS
jgi:hypothetical protein